MKKNEHAGSTLDEFLEEEGTLTEATAVAVKRVLAWQLQEAMTRQHLTKTALASLMQTSRAAVNRLLDPANVSVNLHTLERAAAAVGKQLDIRLR